MEVGADDEGVFEVVGVQPDRDCAPPSPPGCYVTIFCPKVNCARQVNFRRKGHSPLCGRGLTRVVEVGADDEGVLEVVGVQPDVDRLRREAPASTALHNCAFSRCGLVFNPVAGSFSIPRQAHIQPDRDRLRREAPAATARSHRTYSIISLKKSSPPQNRQLVVFYL